VLRDQKYVTCVWPEDRAAVKEPVSADREFELPIPADATSLSDFYQFTLAEVDRIAAQPCQSVVVAPLDNYRFGYEYCIDQNTGMPLRIQTMNSDGATIEQLVFTDITYPDAISDERFALSSDLTGFEVAESAASTQWSSDGNSYKFKGLPVGFKVDSFINQPASEAEPGFHQLILSDGLAKVSLFISTYVHEKAIHGNLQSGAVHVMSTNRDGHELTAVGEVPERTLQVVLDTIQIPQ
jgi:sigma-E factor negative regulatory protein RseB